MCAYNGTNMTGTHILKWNCRGFRSNFNDLRLLCERLDPLSICLQETHLKSTDHIFLQPYTMYHSYAPDGERAAGGSSILVRGDVIHTPITLNTIFQVIATHITLDKAITICAIYIPPYFVFTSHDLENLIDQLPSPKLGVAQLQMARARGLKISSAIKV